MMESYKAEISEQRYKDLLFQALELARNATLAEGHFSDWKDADDVLFSKMDIELGELEVIYEGRGVMVYGGSCFENGQSPKDYAANMAKYSGRRSDDEVRQ